MNGEIEKYIPAIKVDAIDTSGAGDAFIFPLLCSH